eukprot:GHRQ01017453.1.p1 GENE.GHRQ01017453.1~~GHRQ01017453.1.p1  ORF type:complete len:165 (+),score=26.11 GHRQ01017453.1:330-824(+)
MATATLAWGPVCSELNVSLHRAQHVATLLKQLFTSRLANVCQQVPVKSCADAGATSVDLQAVFACIHCVQHSGSWCQAGCRPGRVVGSLFRVGMVQKMMSQPILASRRSTGFEANDEQHVGSLWRLFGHRRVLLSFERALVLVVWQQCKLRLHCPVHQLRLLSC